MSTIKVLVALVIAVLLIFVFPQPWVQKLAGVGGAGFVFYAVIEGVQAIITRKIS